MNLEEMKRKYAYTLARVGLNLKFYSKSAK